MQRLLYEGAYTRADALAVNSALSSFRLTGTIDIAQQWNNNHRRVETTEITQTIPQVTYVKQINAAGQEVFLQQTVNVATKKIQTEILPADVASFSQPEEYKYAPCVELMADGGDLCVGGDDAFDWVAIDATVKATLGI